MKRYLEARLWVSHGLVVLANLMSITIEKFDTLKEYCEAMESLALSKKYVFRGHKDHAWRVTSTFARHSIVCHGGDGVYLDDMHDHFIGNLLSVGASLPFNPSDRRSRMEFARHYGLPSPLIDFSYSHLVALFFAFNGVRPLSSKGCSSVYAIHVDSLSDIAAADGGMKVDAVIGNGALARAKDFKDPGAAFFASGYPSEKMAFFSRPASWNRRMTRQMGVFLYDTLFYSEDGFVDFENRLEKFSESEDYPVPECAIKFEIPHSFAKQIFERLEVAGITGIRLLDDYEGAVADVLNAYNYERRTGYFWDQIAGS